MDLVERFGDGVVESVEVGRDEVGELRVLGMTPERLDRIEVRCIGREPFDVEPLRAALVQLANGRAMDVESVHHDHERTSVLATESAEIPHEVRRPDVALLHGEVLPNLRASRQDTQTADHAQAVMSLRDDLLRTFADRSPSPPIQRLQPKAGFIEKDDDRAPTAGLFLIRGQSCERHRAIAALFRSLARRCGFCGLKPRSCRIRPR